MTTGTRSRRFLDTFRFYGGNNGIVCLRTKIFHWYMSEHFHHCTYASMSWWMPEQPRDGRNTSVAAGSDYPKEFAPEDDDKVWDAGVRQSVYDERPISGEGIRLYSSSGSPSQSPVFVNRDFDWRTFERTAIQ